MEAMLTTRPRPRPVMPGRTAWQNRKGAVTLTASVFSHSSSGVSTVGLGGPTPEMPALLTRMSRAPSRASASATADRTSSGAERSAAMATPLAPSSDRSRSAPSRSMSIRARAVPAAAVVAPEMGGEVGGEALPGGPQRRRREAGQGAVGAGAGHLGQLHGLVEVGLGDLLAPGQAGGGLGEELGLGPAQRALAAGLGGEERLDLGYGVDGAAVLGE